MSSSLPNSELPENRVLAMIYKLDNIGINLNVLQFERFFSNVPELQKVYEKLLFNGDIFELKLLIYPVDSNNLCKAENKEIEEIIADLVLENARNGSSDN